MKLEEMSKMGNSFFEEACITRDKQLYRIALEIFNKEFEIMGSYPILLLNNRGRCFQELGMHKEAINDFSDALDKYDPSKDETPSRRGSFYGPKISESLSNLHYNRGKSQNESGFITNAISDFKKSIEANIYNFQPHLGLSESYFKLKREDKARDNFEEGIKLLCREIKKGYIDKISEIKKRYPSTLNSIRKISQEFKERVYLFDLFED